MFRFPLLKPPGKVDPAVKKHTIHLMQDLSQKIYERSRNPT